MDLPSLMNNAVNGTEDLNFIPPELNLRRRETIGGGAGVGFTHSNCRNEEMRGKMGRKKLCSRGHWRPHEDAKLKELVAQFGPQNWNLIAVKLHGRSGKSCRLRWFNQLDPRVNNRPFTDEEEERLLAAHHLYGNKWALIARLFPGRTDNAVKNHYHVIMARRRKESHDGVHRKLIRTPRYSFSGAAVNGNACSESTTTISSNHMYSSFVYSVMDECALSASTELSLSSSPPYVKAAGLFRAFGGGRGGYHRNLTDCETGSMSYASNRVDHHQHQQQEKWDSSCEISESISNNGDDRESGKFVFIDFLKVGAT